ncbi:hypothetical protein ZWY2020_031501 [Hordeum vulgare]|nr:hypothetical protein ZWY2020_031501 [Hordeum vulgare]
MQGATAVPEVRRSRASPSPDKFDESAKKPRLDLPDGLVKQEAAGGGGFGGAIVAVELAVRIGKHVLHCPLCTLPFKPPVYQCKRGHLACGGCVAQLPCGQCMACVDGAGFFDPCPALDTVVSSTRVQCPNAGCQRYVTYHEAADHQSACAHAPCCCTEPDCGYVGAPQSLAGHLNTVHSVPVRALQYGKAIQLRVPVSALAPRLLLLGDDDNCVFLLSVGALDAGTAAVSVVCARASAVARPRFTCKMWVNLEPAAASGARADSVRVEMQMRSSTSPGAVLAVQEPTFLAVPPMYLVPPPAAAAGDKAAMEVPLYIRIDKVSPWSSDALV